MNKKASIMELLSFVSLFLLIIVFIVLLGWFLYENGWFLYENGWFLYEKGYSDGVVDTGQDFCNNRVQCVSSSPRGMIDSEERVRLEHENDQKFMDALPDRKNCFEDINCSGHISYQFYPEVKNYTFCFDNGSDYSLADDNEDIASIIVNGKICGSFVNYTTTLVPYSKSFMGKDCRFEYYLWKELYQTQVAEGQFCNPESGELLQKYKGKWCNEFWYCKNISGFVDIEGVWRK